VVEPFEIAIPEAQVADLKRRLAGTRLTTAPAGEAWESGIDYGYLSGLLEYWQEGFDWRFQEQRLNSFPQYIAEVEGNRIHFVHIKDGDSDYPIIVTHGWPYTFVEMLALVPHLPGFSLVFPSLPGHAFSKPLLNRPFTADNVARLWHQLMNEVLGYERYVTYGEDVGAGVSDWLGALFPEAVAGIFATHAAFPPNERLGDLTEAETNFIEWLNEKWQTGRGYAHLQGTRPDTLAVGLNDSPSGLLAWIVEKLHEWSGEDFNRSWDRDDLLTTASLYWFTESIGTSFLSYYDGKHEPSLPMIDVPVGVSVQWGERGFPSEYAARTYRDIRIWKDLTARGPLRCQADSRTRRRRPKTVHPLP
jgi:pimeloyl-ACP methyl ester carboxylesterase